MHFFFVLVFPFKQKSFSPVLIAEGARSTHPFFPGATASH
uniref:Uncharacterized protein n=1 Tax=Arundo donax TaxID=35708 RepID=A0A0A9C546_ARUDO